MTSSEVSVNTLQFIVTGSTVGDSYTPKAITVSPEASLGDCATLMAEKSVHTLPVVENGKLVGVIGKLDLIRGLAQD